MGSCIYKVLAPSPDSSIWFTEVSVNNETFNKEKGVSVTCCATVTISVVISNKADISYKNMSLRFEPYQDHANGYRASELNGKVAWIGDLSSCENEVVRGTSFQHSCSFVFFYAGEYLIDITCTADDNNTKDILSARDKPAACKWTFSPPLKIQVTT
ncbi:uncharacterized protein LOC110239343 [Exaiptasia diaphana]|uniref:Trs120/TRAPPC9 fourth Ig-like domain-containing protein n=1 Tax=Exaiptasia diaphana TaxID=2652724 RepID=A0A913X9Z2_EXADI|nr:uncharacterized protein LOC110239343 [Exaiptasia diaphana]